MARTKKSEPVAEWRVGKFTASFKDGWYTLRSGPSLFLHTDCEENFKQYCALIDLPK